MQQTTMLKPLPIGIEFFSDMIEREYYYIDKTLFIKDILDNKSNVVLCTRPRRFGKTLNQTMLQCFFEDTKPLAFKNENKRHLFKGLKIEISGESYMQEQGQYPVIFLSLKSSKQPSFEESFTQLRSMITTEFKRHKYVLDLLSEEDKNQYEFLSLGKGTPKDYNASLKFLCECLYLYHKKNTVILIDEYDVPLENSYFNGFYAEMVSFIRSLLESALKTNDKLKLAVLTGCLRISKESIFTGLNNFEIISILDERYSKHFGFTQNEIDEMLKYYNIEFKREDIKDWYNGYMFGDTNVYNPWSAIKILVDWSVNPNSFPRPFWVNTSSNTIVQNLIDKMDSEQNEETKNELEILISGKAIKKTIHEDMTYDEINNNINNIWNFLFFTGYLTKAGESMDGNNIVIDMIIPNREIAYIFENKIRYWFENRIKMKDLKPLYNAILTGDAQKFENLLNEELMDSMSYFDTAENFYHGFMLGILRGAREFTFESNKESGKGRSDIIMRNRSHKKQAIIFEFKFSKEYPALEGLCEDALKQIETEKYTYSLEKEGYKKENIMKYGIAFCGKECLVR